MRDSRRLGSELRCVSDLFTALPASQQTVKPSSYSPTVLDASSKEALSCLFNMHPSRRASLSKLTHTLACDDL